MPCISVFSGPLNEHLPAEVRLLPPKDEEGERTRLQFVFIKRKIINNHGLLVAAGELEGWMSCPARDRAGVHVRPEGFRQGPEPDREPFLGGPLDVDQLPAGVPGRVRRRNHRVRSMGSGAGAGLPEYRRFDNFNFRFYLALDDIFVPQEGGIAACLLEVNDDTGLELLD